MKDFSVIPSISSLLENGEYEEQIKLYGREKVKRILTKVIESVRLRINKGEDFTIEQIDQMIAHEFQKNMLTELKPIINCTGTLLHTNLGRAILSKKVMEEVSTLLTNYVNVEFDLKTGKRGKRGEYVNQLLCTLTNAESAMVVNNNAGAVFLILSEFAKDKEVLVSRGELVEIGGSFRVPDIMRESGAILTEVGTTNKTKLSDYEQNINDKSSMIMKVHQSNFYISGFTEEADISNLITLAKEKNVISYYDVGSGLLNKLSNKDIEWDHSVKEVVDMGIDLVSFSGDKLLGSTQAGLIVGKKEYIDRLKKNPLYRILRVGKLTDSVLYYTLKNYLDFDADFAEIPFFKMLNQTATELKNKAEKLTSLLDNISKDIIETKVRTGGGSMPSVTLKSYAVQIAEAEEKNVKANLCLLESTKPIITYLSQGMLNIDIIAVEEEDLIYISEEINRVYKSL